MKFQWAYFTSGQKEYEDTGCISSAPLQTCLHPDAARTNHRMLGVGRDLCGSSSPTSLPKRLNTAKATDSHSGKKENNTQITFLKSEF